MLMAWGRMPSRLETLRVATDKATSGSTRRAEFVEGWARPVRTPCGGLHACFLRTTEEQRSWQAPSNHIDFGGDGGYHHRSPRVTSNDGVTRSYEQIAVAERNASDDQVSLPVPGDLAVGDLLGTVVDGDHPDDRPRPLTSRFARPAADAPGVQADAVRDQLGPGRA